MEIPLTVCLWDDRVVSVQLRADDLVDSLKAILEAETGVPSGQQQLRYGGRLLQNTQTLQQCGLSPEDVLELLPPSAPSAAAPAAAPSATTLFNPDGSAVAPAALIQQLVADPAQLAAIRANNPALGRAIDEQNVEALQEELRRVQRRRAEEGAELARQQELLAADPLDPEVQRKIEELIQQKNIEENLAAALEYNPEVFGTVDMLYVNMDVNGQPIKTFVDSGAQTSIMTLPCADRCRLTHLIDKRFAGVAVGVGSSKIIGRIHQAQLKVQGQFITTSITVLEQKDGPQFIFGLDMLKRHQCVVDLRRNVLVFGSCAAELPFLAEHEIPKDFKRQVDAGGLGDVAPAPGSSAGPPAPLQSTTHTGAATAAPGPAPVAQPGSSGGAPGAGGGVEEKVQRLLGLGFTRAQCEAALNAAGGNEDLAASFLFGGL